MIAIGIRATPKEIAYCLLNFDQDCYIVISVDKIKMPIALNFPEQLRHIRTAFTDVIKQNKVTHAGIRTAEASAMKVNIPRTAIEGVMQELLASSSIEKYFVGQIANIASAIKFDRKMFKEYVSGNIDFPSIENWGSYDETKREAILAAIASTNL